MYMYIYMYIYIYIYIYLSIHAHACIIVVVSASDLTDEYVCPELLKESHHAEFRVESRESRV